MRRRLPLITFLLAVLVLAGVGQASAVVGPVSFAGTSQYGDVVVGTSLTETFDISNTGDTDGTIGASGAQVASSDGFAEVPGSDTCANLILLAGAANSCQVEVRYTPIAAGTGNGSLTLDSTDLTDSLPLSGTGVLLDVTPSPYDFLSHKVGDSADPSDYSATHTFTLHNNGAVDLTGLVIAVSGQLQGFSGPSNGNCGTSLTSGSSCNFDVTFAAKADGAASGSISISSNDLSAPVLVSLSGTGTVPTATPSSTLSFTTAINTSETKTITLTNTGLAPLVVESAALTGDTATFTKVVTATPCGGTTLAPGDHCTVDIRFLPNTSAAQNATLTFTDDSDSVPGSTQPVSITGTVLIPGISSNPESVSFQHLPLGRLSAKITATITNTGQAGLHISSLMIGGLNYKSFRLVGQTCTQAAIAPGDNCLADIKFAPTKLGTRVATLVVKSDASSLPLNVALTGTAVRPASTSGLRASAGCTDARLTWRNPDAAGFVRVRVVRNSAHVPRGPSDGVIIKHTSGQVTDTGLAQFDTYHYGLYAVYISFDHSHVVYSAVSAATLRTGRICMPRNGSLISDLSPPVDWTPYPGARYYAYILQRFGHTILVRYPKHSQTTLPSSWTINGQSKSIQHGATYTLYLYAYTSGRPNGFLIGQTTFTER